MRWIYVMPGYSLLFVSTCEVKSAGPGKKKEMKKNGNEKGSNKITSLLKIILLIFWYVKYKTDL